jgi:transcription elongation factor Elf1
MLRFNVPHQDSLAREETIISTTYPLTLESAVKIAVAVCDICGQVCDN